MVLEYYGHCSDIFCTGKISGGISSSWGNQLNYIVLLKTKLRDCMVANILPEKPCLLFLISESLDRFNTLGFFLAGYSGTSISS
jgi:hypothetical protein